MLRTLVLSSLVALAAMPIALRADPGRATSPRPMLAGDITAHYRTVAVNGVDVFYREAGPRDAPAVLLLHGFPTSSRMFRNLTSKSWMTSRSSSTLR